MILDFGAANMTVGLICSGRIALDTRLVDVMCDWILRAMEENLLDATLGKDRCSW